MISLAGIKLYRLLWWHLEE